MYHETRETVLRFSCTLYRIDKPICLQQKHVQINTYKHRQSYNTRIRRQLHPHKYEDTPYTDYTYTVIQYIIPYNVNSILYTVYCVQYRVFPSTLPPFRECPIRSHIPAGTYTSIPSDPIYQVHARVSHQIPSTGKASDNNPTHLRGPILEKCRRVQPLHAEAVGGRQRRGGSCGVVAVVVGPGWRCGKLSADDVVVVGRVAVTEVEELPAVKLRRPTLVQYMKSYGEAKWIGDNYVIQYQVNSTVCSTI